MNAARDAVSVVGDIITGKTGIGKGMTQIYADIKSSAGLISGGLIGALGGAALGTIFIPIPIVGTLVGAMVGAPVGVTAAGAGMIAVDALKSGKAAVQATGEKVSEIIDKQMERGAAQDQRKHELEMAKVNANKEIAKAQADAQAKVAAAALKQPIHPPVTPALKHDHELHRNQPTQPQPTQPDPSNVASDSKHTKPGH